MFRKRRAMEQKSKSQKASENFSRPRDFYHSCDSGCFPWKDMSLENIMKCEAGFFCQVLSRLSKEIKYAQDLDDLDDIIEMASKFLLASAAKEKAIAWQIAVSNGILPGNCDPDFKALFNETTLDEQWFTDTSDYDEESTSDEFDSFSQED
ncbi:MAG: hypothetical protein ACOYI2_06635 [Bacillota bacterium]|jgi:hypothetical protein|nr:hypothetical protein [Clostridia bacterium]